MRPMSLRSVACFTIGFLGSMFLCKVFMRNPGHVCRKSSHSDVRSGEMQAGIRNGLQSIQKRSNIYLGMMSAGKFVTNRVQRNIDTWLQKGGWKVEVFADGDPSLLKVPPGLDINIVTMKVDDKAYPPQKKSFLLIRHMYDNHINDFDWFIRADDDSYTDFPRLERLLNKMNSSLPIYFGNPGFGMDADDGIEEGMKYLMGGLGMIFSRGMLIKLRPHLRYCIQHLFSPHEDIEIGRCVWKHTKSITPIAWETIDLFYQQYDKETGDVIDIKMDQLTPKRTEKTIIYHSVKTAELMHRLHKQVLNRNLHALLNRSAVLRNEMAHMKKMIELHLKFSKTKDPDSVLPLVIGGVSESSSSTDRPWPDDAAWHPRNASFNRVSPKIPWLFMDKYYRYDIRDPIVPMRGHSKVERDSMAKMFADIESKLIPHNCHNFPATSQFSFGYMQYGNLEGVKVMTLHRSVSGSSMKQCRTFSQVSYGVTLFNEELPLFNHSRLKLANKPDAGILDGILGVKDPAVNDVQAVGNMQFSPLEGVLKQKKDRVIFVIPLQGRYRALEQFMESYEKNFLKTRGTQLEQNVQLAIVLLGNDDQGDDLGLNRASAHLLRSYQSTYGPELIRYHVASTGDRSFSRGAGIQLGSLIGKENDILFFMDIDMVVTQNVVAQCRSNINQGGVAWYPIPYSQYDPDKLCFQEENGMNSPLEDGGHREGRIPRGGDDNPHGRQYIRDHIHKSPLTLSTDRGFWRDFGFGIACMYKSDFVRTGGFDLTIEGWGEEDIRLFVSLIKSKIDVFRARQVDLVHIFHQKYCDMDISDQQRKACLRTKASHFASQRCLANNWFRQHRE